jgi:hypothetical protein
MTQNVIVTGPRIRLSGAHPHCNCRRMHAISPDKTAQPMGLLPV